MTTTGRSANGLSDLLKVVQQPSIPKIVASATRDDPQRRLTEIYSRWSDGLLTLQIQRWAASIFDSPITPGPYHVVADLPADLKWHDIEELARRMERPAPAAS